MSDFDDLIDDDIKAETAGDDESRQSGEGKAEKNRNRLAESVESVKSTEWMGLAKASMYGLLLIPMMLLTPIVRVMPMSWKLYHKLHIWSAWQMQKAAGADAIANVRHPNDKEDVRPAAFVEGGEDDRERTGWKVKGIDNKRYDPSVRGGASSRLGKADLIHINEDDLEQGTWAETVMDSALQLNRERYLFRDAQVTEETRVVPTDPSLGGGQTPVADGGVDMNGNGDGVNYQPVSRHISIDSPGIHEDTLIPLTSRTGYDGQLVSFEQYRHLKNEQADQETVRDAKNAGWMAAKLDDVGKGDILKWAIIIGIGGVILLFHQDIGAAISGFGSGGGGNVAPSAGLGLIPLIKARFGGE